MGGFILLSIIICTFASNCPIRSRHCLSWLWELHKEDNLTIDDPYMPEPKLRFALFGNEYQPEKTAFFLRIIEELQAHGAHVSIDSTFYDFLCQDVHFKSETVQRFEGQDFDADFVISVGGDGTFLKAARRVGIKQIPLIGVNTGRLGFLANILPSELKEAIADIYAHHYELERHSVIQLETNGDALDINPYALNDIAILKRDNAAMITIRACVNDDYLVTYQADGLVIATPTGSTAYNLSNGGPIMVPSTSNLCLTPVAPHSLNIRPIVINDNNVITLTVESRSHNFLAAIDGRSTKLGEHTQLTIRKAPFATLFVKRFGQRYFSTLREKMMWGADTRG